MMNKIASDAYSQGAYEALQQMNVPGHIKEATAQYLIKEAIPGGATLRSAGSRIADAFKSGGGVGSAIGAVRGRGGDVGRMQALKEMDHLRALKDLGIAGGLTTAGGLGVAGAAGAFDDEPEGWDSLSDAQKAMIIGGGGLAAAGTAYGLSQLT